MLDHDEYKERFPYDPEDDSEEFPSLKFAALIFVVFAIGVLAGSFWVGA